MKLSNEQLKVVEEMKQGLYVWTNEGSNLEAWMGDENGNKVRSLRVRTVEILANKEIIEAIDGDHPKSLYKFQLTGVLK